MAFASVFIALIGNMLGSFLVKTVYVQHGSQSIVAMSDGTSSSGSFFLGSGYLNGHQVYNFYTRDDRGGMQLNSTYASDGTIYENPSVFPHVAYWYKESSNKWLSLSPQGTQRLEVFTVPPGSVKTNFTLDTKP
jgi:hypothetical protein